MSEAEKQKRWLGDGPMRASIIGVAGSALALSAGALAFSGKDMAIGVAIGGVLATVNLWVFAQIGEAFLSRRGNSAPWAAIGAVKLAALVCAVWLILRSGYATGLSLAVGYGALPIGITLASLFGPKPPDDDSNKDGTNGDLP